jgi:hypothetical protein
MYINSNNQGMYHPSFKSLASAKKCDSPVATDPEQISNSNNSVNSKQNSKKVENTIVGSADEKRQYHATVPLKHMQ